MNLEEEYTYYNPIKIKEHMINTKEIAMLLNVKSEAGKFHGTFIKAALKNNLAKYPDDKKYFYETKHGLMQVYPMDYIIKNLICVLSAPILLYVRTDEQNVSMYECKISGKTYKLFVSSGSKNPLKDLVDYWKTL